MNIGFFGTIIGTILIIAVGIIYYMLVSNRNHVNMKKNAVNISIKKRWGLIPAFIDIVKNYSAIEEQTLEKLLALTNQEYDKFKLQKKIEVDTNISKVISKIIGICENNFDISENEQYVNIRNQLIKLDREIINLKKSYFEASKKYNNIVKPFPNNIVAILFGFNEEIECIIE